jgi:tRNA (mo5U34)-methyltransferase
MGLSQEEKREMIERVKFWYHTIDLGDGLLTPGWEHIRKLNQAMLDFLPVSFKGLSVLDVGCWDGLFSFEAERRGAARVLGIDNHSGGDGCSQEKLVSQKEEGFKPLITVKAILDSHVEYQTKNVYDLAPENVGLFDCSIFFGVLYHLWHPMLALQLIRQVTKKCLFIETHVNEAIDPSQPLIRLYRGGEKYEGTTWVGPNLLGLYEMLLLAGFQNIHLYRFRDHYERAIGMAFVDDKMDEGFQLRHDEQFTPFDPRFDPRSLAELEVERAANLRLIDEQGSRLAELEAERERMIRSFSFRITAPLRWVRRKVSGLI